MGKVAKEIMNIFGNKRQDLLIIILEDKNKENAEARLTLKLSA